MIAHVRGQLAAKTPQHAIVDVGGVGYEVLIPLSTYNQLPGVGEEVRLHTYYSLRQDEARLYGFFSRDEKQLFTSVLPVSGIGPAMAINILSRLTPIQFRLAVMQNDTSTLSQIKGISQQRARELIVKLKKKMDELEFAEQVIGAVEAPALAKVVGALVGLGVSQTAADQAALDAHKVLGEEADFDELIALALRYAARPNAKA